MKRCAFIFAVLALLLPVAAQAQFEGVIDMKMTMFSDEKPKDIFYTISVQDHNLAMTMKGMTETGEKGEKGRFIFRGDSKVLWILSDESKSYMEISLKDEQKRKRSEKAAKPADLGRRTGKTETILGYPCEEWIVEEKENDEVTHVWATSKLGGVYEWMMQSMKDAGGPGAADDMEGWEKDFVARHLFPLKVITKEGGKVTQQQEVTRIEKTSVPKSMFEAPEGYTKQSLGLDMQKMMKEMQEQMEKGQRDKEEADTSDVD